MLRARLLVSGLVQGVGFRSYARNHAKSLGLKGFVHNLPSGRVEIVVEGYHKQIDELHKLLAKGPFGASIEHIDLIWEEPKNEFNDFAVR